MNMRLCLPPRASLIHLNSATMSFPGCPLASFAVQVPLPIAGLASRRVLVMDYVEGTPLNRLSEKMKERGIEASGCTEVTGTPTLARTPCLTAATPRAPTP